MGDRATVHCATMPPDGRRGEARPAALHHGRQRRRRQVDADRPAAARRRRDLRRPARSLCARRRSATARSRSTSRSSPTASGPSASRASRSTSRTATSRRRSGASSSPTRPGHVQYTRNMATGASTADLAIILIDARLRRPDAVEAARASSPRCSASRASSWRSTRWTSSATTRTSSTRIRDEYGDVRRAARVRRPHVHSDQRARAATTSSPGANGCRGSTGVPLLDASRDRLHRRGRQPHRLPLPRAARRAARRHDFRGYAGQIVSGDRAAGRRGRRAAVRHAHAHHADRRRSGRTSTYAFPPAVGHAVPRGRHRRQPRRHDRASQQRAPGRARDRGDGRVDGGRAAGRGARRTWSSTRRGR